MTIQPRRQRQALAGRRALYQLKGDAAFTNAEFFALFDDEQKVLGPELIGREEYVLAPSEKRTVESAVSGAARFVGVDRGVP